MTTRSSHQRYPITGSRRPDPADSRRDQATCAAIRHCRAESCFNSAEPSQLIASFDQFRKTVRPSPTGGESTVS